MLWRGLSFVSGIAEGYETGAGIEPAVTEHAVSRKNMPKALSKPTIALPYKELPFFEFEGTDAPI